jgi:hypothetical protein
LRANSATPRLEAKRHLTQQQLDWHKRYWMLDMQTKFVEANGLRFEVLEEPGVASLPPKKGVPADCGKAGAAYRMQRPLAGGAAALRQVAARELSTLALIADMLKRRRMRSGRGACLAVTIATRAYPCADDRVISTAFAPDGLFATGQRICLLAEILKRGLYFSERPAWAATS